MKIEHARELVNGAWIKNHELQTDAQFEEHVAQLLVSETDKARRETLTEAAEIVEQTYVGGCEYPGQARSTIKEAILEARDKINHEQPR